MYKRQGEITPEVSLNINGLPLNPVTREYPRNYINTGISAIDGLTTLIRGQKLPIFSGNGLPHDKLAAQIVQQASLGADSDEKFAIVFAAMGVKYDVAEFFRRTFEESGADVYKRQGSTSHIQHRSIHTQVNNLTPPQPRTPKKKPEGCAEGPWLYGPFAVFLFSHKNPKKYLFTHISLKILQKN